MDAMANAKRVFTVPRLPSGRFLRPHVARPMRLTSKQYRYNRPATETVSITCSASPSTAPAQENVEPESKNFIDEMRGVAMKLHTKDQAKEGEQKAQPKPFQSWEYSKEGYLRFLVESKVVYDALEEIINGDASPDYVHFRDTGLERSESLVKDIAWMEETYGLTRPAAQPDGPGTTYTQVLHELSSTDPPAFICHFYNVYFAHTAGGRMIGKKVADMVLDGAFSSLAFYKYEGNLKKKMEAVKSNLNEVASRWTRQQKDHCLEETERSFKLSGTVLRSLFQP